MADFAAASNEPVKRPVDQSVKDSIRGVEALLRPLQVEKCHPRDADGTVVRDSQAGPSVQPGRGRGAIAVNSACPDASQYRRLAAGKLPRADEVSLLRHLEGCDDCARRLKGMREPGMLAALIKRAETLSDVSPDGTIAGLLGHTSRPSDAPAAKASARPAVRRPAKELYDFLAPPQEADELGRLGSYRALSVLGTGGMGVVFKAFDVRSFDGR